MGEVYEATDTRLARRVAVKILPGEFASDPSRLARFEQEARAAAALSHPHIAAVYDVGADGTTQFIVQELVTGRSLREHLTARSDRPIAEWLPLGAEIAAALAAAHHAGIVHRDIKPENVMVSEDGHVKVLDFGLAKLTEPGGAGLVDTNSPTVLGTMAGTVMGTVGYLAPEQAAGQAVDRRADIFAVGCILYEMAAGERPFAGRSAAEIIAHVLHDEPQPLQSRRPNLPPEFHRIVGKCLAKDPARRYQHADDLALDLRELAANPAASPERSPVSTTRSARLPGLAWLVALAIVGAAGVAGWLRAAPEVPSQPPTRLAIPVPNFGGASTALQRQIAITPNGATVLYVATIESRNRTMRLDLDKSQPEALAGVRDFLADYVVSPDGREFIGTVAGSPQMLRYPIDGGSARPLPADLPSSSFIAWARDGTVWSSVWNNAVYRVDAGDRVTKVQALASSLELAQMLPGDRLALAINIPSGSSGQALIVDVASGQSTPMLDGAVVEIRYAAGHLVYVQADGTLNAVPFDLATRQVRGRPVRIAEGVMLTGTGIAQFGVADNGTVVYMPEEPRSLVLVGRDGRSRPATTERRNFHAPMFSPDGRRVSMDFTSADGRDVWVLDLQGNVMSRTTFDRDGHDATWSADGTALTYLSTSRGAQGVYRTRIGGGGREQLIATQQIDYSGLWLPDHKALITVSTQTNSPETGLFDISVVRLGGDRPVVESLVASRFTEDRPAVSRDGKWLAFTSNQSGREEVYVRPIAGTGEQVQISADGGVEPVFGPDGRELFYRGGTAQATAMLMRAAFVTEPTFTVTSRAAMFSVADIATATPHRNYDISPDGQTFAMVQYNPGTRIMVIQNLPALVRKLSGN
jgi:serine/threonine-protein kinase